MEVGQSLRLLKKLFRDLSAFGGDDHNFGESNHGFLQLVIGYIGHASKHIRPHHTSPEVGHFLVITDNIVLSGLKHTAASDRFIGPTFSQRQGKETGARVRDRVSYKKNINSGAVRGTVFS